MDRATIYLVGIIALIVTSVFFTVGLILGFNMGEAHGCEECKINNSSKIIWEEGPNGTLITETTETRSERRYSVLAREAEERQAERERENNINIPILRGEVKGIIQIEPSNNTEDIPKPIRFQEGYDIGK